MEDERKGFMTGLLEKYLLLNSTNQVNGYMMSGWMSLLIFINS